MTTSFTCVTPDEGWEECYKHVDTYLRSFALLCSQTRVDQGKIDEIRAQLLGHLFTISYRMHTNGHISTCDNIFKIIKAVCGPSEICQAELAEIRSLHAQLNPRWIELESGRHEAEKMMML